MPTERTLRIARPSQHWQAGGLIQRVEWSGESGRLRLWDGTIEEAREGDTVLLLWRGLPTVDVVAVERRGAAA